MPKMKTFLSLICSSRSSKAAQVHCYGSDQCTEHEEDPAVSLIFGIGYSFRIF